MKREIKISAPLATLFIIMAGCLWGTMGIFVRNLANDRLTTFEIVFLRSSLAAFLLLIYLLIFDKDKLRIKLKDIWCFIGTGIISLTFFNICYFTTIQRTSMAIAAILLYTSPIFVVIFSAILFKEKIDLVKIIALIIAFAGCVLVTGIGNGNMVMDITGILIGVMAGIGYALYSIFGKYALIREYSSLTISFYTFLFSSIGMLIASPFITPINEMFVKISQGRTARDILLIVGISIVATIMPYLLYTMGLSKVENGKAGIMASIEPVVAALIGIIVYKETLSLNGILGMLMVLGAIVLLNIRNKDK